MSRNLWKQEKWIKTVSEAKEESGKKKQKHG